LNLLVNSLQMVHELLSGKKKSDESLYNLNHKNDIWFYYFKKAYRQIQLSKTKLSKNELLGVYDIIFVHGNSVEQYANRTARGTVTLTQTEGVVELDDAGKIACHFLLLSDFQLSNFDFDAKDRSGNCVFAFDAMLEKYEMGHPYFHQDDGDTHDDDLHPRRGSIRRIENRIAMPWMKFESGKKYNRRCFSIEEEEEKKNKDHPIQFGSIEEAEKLNRDHQNRYERSWLVSKKGLPLEISTLIHDFHAYRPNPVFFIEPGDLILGVIWDDDWAESKYILRKRKEDHTRKRTIGDVYDQETQENWKKSRNPEDFDHIWR